MKTFFVSAALALLVVATPRRELHAQAAAPARQQAATRREQHPRIHAAIRELEAAKAELQKAPHDFGGHRADAVVAVDKAIEQLRLALQYDKK
jgi:hypothetical protein